MSYRYLNFLMKLTAVLTYKPVQLLFQVNIRSNLTNQFDIDIAGLCKFGDPNELANFWYSKTKNKIN